MLRSHAPQGRSCERCARATGRTRCACARDDEAARHAEAKRGTLTSLSRVELQLEWLTSCAEACLGGEDRWHGDVTSVEGSGWFKGGGCADGGVVGGCVGRQRRGEQGRGTPLCLAYA